ncbi:hypothetical protein [Polaromonas sp. Pch-P]|uniref:hypothetical protein n=2 Tax=unclassified Polaromonas TaxID=2638319 RepID=UPI00129DCC91|nr:hypothetical protein [Polaromonas sp. Pch-P]QGJ19573.1 hypothetical protein F7R28_15025 [Polaromonas sp. Pch-P]
MDEDAKRVQPKKGHLFPLVAGVILMVALGGFGLTRLYPPSVPDHVSQSEAKERSEAFAKIKSFPVSIVPQEKTVATLANMGLKPPELEALSQALAQPSAKTTPVGSPSPAAAVGSEQKVSLVELVLWDTHAPDGDMVRITSAGYARDVLLSKIPTVIHVPGIGAGVIQVTGLKDGGGGITLGIKGSQQSVLMPIMSEGQSLSLPVNFQ